MQDPPGHEKASVARMVGYAKTGQVPDAGVSGLGSKVQERPARLKLAIRRPGPRMLVALLMPFLTSLVQHMLWPVIQPFAWFLFYPAVIFSAWFSGTAGGILATCVSSFLVWWLYVPPTHVLIKEEPRYILSGLIYVSVGFVFSIVQGKLQKTSDELADALEDARVAGAAIQAARDDLQKLIERSPDGIFITDASGKLLHVNATAIEMSQQEHERRPELTGQLIATILSDLDPAKFLRPLTWGRLQLGEQALRRKEDADLPVDVSASIFPDGRWLISARDITERKAAERHLQQVSRANRALSRCNQALVRAVEEPKLLEQICNVVEQDAGYPFCWVGEALQDESKTVRVIAHSGRDGEYLDGLRMQRISWSDSEGGRGPTGTCIRTGEIVTCQDIASATDMAPWREQAQRHGYSASIAIPLFVSGKIFGALSIYASEADAFSREEVELLKELADDLAFGISSLRIRAEKAKAELDLLKLNMELEERVRARTQELEQAREREFETGSRIQKTLLIDRPPAHLPGVRVATLAVPTEHIDGDFILFLEPRERSFDVIVGDVMGKGIPAALLGAATKTHILKALGQLSVLAKPDRLPAPEDIVMLAHAGMAAQLVDLESFVTLSYVRIDSLRGVAELVDCGHTGMIQRHGSTGRVEHLRGENLPLGVKEDEVYRQRQIRFGARDLLFLFSDGVTEARSPEGELFGLDRLLAAIEEQGDFDPAELIERLRKLVGAHCGCGHLADDLTMVAIRLDEVGQPVARAKQQFKSNLRELHRIREFVRAFCGGISAQRLGDDDIAALALAINETASNIMKHAYHGLPDQDIHVAAEVFSGRLVVRLCHSGCAFSCPPEKLSFDGPRESGLGLYMVSRCVDEVHYYQDERGRNCVSLTKFLNGGAERNA